jgi:repressor LexA
MSEVLTTIERRIYNYLVDYLKRETFQPSIREIGTRFGIRSTKTVTEHLQSLQRKGYLDRTPSRSRALRILGLNLSPDTYTIPLYGNGSHETADDVEARFDLDRSFACSADCFMVRACGNGLNAHGILEGDMLVVEPCQEVKGSELSVFENEGGVELRAGEPNGVNGSPPPRFIGVVRAVLRTFPKD